MSWFGGNSKKEEEPSFPSQFENNNSFEYSTPSPQSSGSSSSLQDILLQEQQKAMVQGVIFKLADMSFESCISKPSSSISSSEKSCIKSVVAKFIDTSEFVVLRMSRQS